MTVGELKEILANLSDSTPILITSDEEWNHVRKCDGFNADEYLWDKSYKKIISTDELDEYDEEDRLNMVNCLILC